MTTSAETGVAVICEPRLQSIKVKIGKLSLMGSTDHGFLKGLLGQCSRIENLLRNHGFTEEVDNLLRKCEDSLKGIRTPSLANI